MANIGKYGRMVWGAGDIVRNVSAGGTVSAYALKDVNNCWAVRFTAKDIRDVREASVNWQTVSSPGAVQLRIETIDATTGKPTGTLYDANASKSFTPAAGWQTIAFDVEPTTGLVAGNEYAVLLLTTSAATTQTVRSHFAPSAAGAYPTVLMTATDGSTRSNLAEVSNSIPVVTVGFDDGSEEAVDSCPFPITDTSFTIYGARAAGARIEVPCRMVVSGVECAFFMRLGSPDDLRIRIYDGGESTSGLGNLMTNASATIDKDSLTNVHTKGFRRSFGSLVTLQAGIYRVILDQTNHSTTSGNTYNFRVADSARSSVVVPSGHVFTTTTDIDAGPVTWTNTLTAQIPLSLVLDTASQSVGTSRARLVNGA